MRTALASLTLLALLHAHAAMAQTVIAAPGASSQALTLTSVDLAPTASNPIDPPSDPRAAGPASTAASTNADTDHRWRYSLGLKWRVDDVGYPTRDGSLRPMLGLRYGRWRLGANTGEDWLRYASYIKESNVEYDWLERDRLRVGLSARIQNLTDNDSFDGFGGGRNTVRARAHITWRLTARWSIGGEVTQDLLARGDGTTLTAGLSYLWPLSERSSLGLSAGATWATASHLQNRYRELALPAGGWQAGLSNLGGGVSWRYSMARHWAWFATLGSSRPLGQLNEVSPSVAIWNGQIGLLYFSH